MLLPGAIYFVGFGLAVVGIAICFLASCVGGIVSRFVAEAVLCRTKQDKLYHSGAKNADRWWLNRRLWTFSGMFLTWSITAYCLVGPIQALILYLGGR